ncbi:hypothetical protein AX14_000764 [Amanita brunnescens Koide BX004]|nr:hypothetical protein AX14_000764 [Amanita brunnescens Koide BX004]
MGLQSTLTYTFECWIVGDLLTERFLVEVNSDKRVKDLRRAIKQERDDALRDTKVVNIMLWKVCELLIVTIPALPTSTGFKWDHWHEENIQEAISQAYPLAATERLSSVYPTTPEQDHVHVIVWTRELNLSCCVIAEETRRIFPVTISNNQCVADLQRLIKEKTHSAAQLNNDNALDLVLWTVSISTKNDKRHKNIVQFLEDINNADPLLPTERLSNIYPMPPQQDHLHIVISYPLDLVCWIVENNIDRKFTITMGRVQRVGDLRHARAYSLAGDAENQGCEHFVLAYVGLYPFLSGSTIRAHYYWADAILKRPDQLTDDLNWSDIFVMPPESGHIHIAVWHTKLSSVRSVSEAAKGLEHSMEAYNQWTHSFVA